MRFGIKVKLRLIGKLQRIIAIGENQGIDCFFCALKNKLRQEGFALSILSHKTGLARKATAHLWAN